MLELVLILHIIIAVAIIALVLVQHGKGADMGASFGSGSSGTIFGSRGAAPFMLKLTGLLAALFFITALTLGHLSSLKAAQSLELPVTQTTKPMTTKDDKQVDQLLEHSNGNNDLIEKIQKQTSSSNHE
ncbi:preprotein translocase subunit SecG [Thiotrichales bacterium 19S3-7]|nr:preprotein translocase subunit SecG [Thiotrichales bacterium 19S3-7]MCF6800720.1 preprotein translocase subunit SecG [Thiotrichales bacterium 19S3-11]